VAHLVSGALGVASRAWGGLGELSAFVGHAGHSLDAIGVVHAGLGSGKVALSHHASAHGLAHGVAGAVTIDHHELSPVSRAAQLEVHAALGLSGESGAVGIAGAGVHVLGLSHHDGFHHGFLVVVHFHGGSGQTDEKGDDEELHGDFWVGFGRQD